MHTPSLITFCRTPYHDNSPNNFSSPACTCLEHTTVYIALPFTNARPPRSPVCRVEGGRGFCFASASLERSYDVNHDAYSITSYVTSQLWHNLKSDAFNSKMLAIKCIVIFALRNNMAHKTIILQDYDLYPLRQLISGRLHSAAIHK
jgi:hypothetical protein